MALTYTTASTDWFTAPTGSGNPEYKDVTVSCATGDLLIAIGMAENQAAATGTNGGVATQTGSTSAWTQAGTPDPVQNDDVAFTIAWATVSSGTSVTVRVTINAADTVKMGAAVIKIPAAEWDSGTNPTFTAMGPGYAGNGSTVAQSATLSATSTVIWAGGDWAALYPGTTSTPSGATNHANITDGGGTSNGSLYAVAIRSWTGQAAGTRDYGLGADPGAVDYTGSVVVVKELSGDQTREVNDDVDLTDTRNVNSTQITYNRTVLIG